MRIAIITPVYPPYGGGMGTVARDQAVMLTRAGHEVTVFTPRKRAGFTPTTGVSLRGLRPVCTYGNAALLPQLFFALDDFDVVHLHYPFLGAAEFVLWWKALSPRRTRLVLTYHMDLVGSGALARVFNAYSRHILPNLVEHSDAITVTSADYVRASLLSKLPAGTRKKTVVLPPSVDLMRFAPASRVAKHNQSSEEFLRGHFRIGAKEQVVLFVGSLDRAHYFKGVSILLHAFLKLRSHIPAQRATLVIAGDGNLRPDYERLAAALGIRDRVIFLGKVSDEDLPAVYQMADVVVLPSVDRSEAFGIVLLEAMASGKPVIASNLPGVRTLIAAGKNGFLVSPGDEESLAATLSRLLAKRSVIQKMGQASRTLARAYAETRVAARLVKLYRAL